MATPANAVRIAKQALHLPVKERAKLARRLLVSLDVVTKGEADKLWLSEAERRGREIDEGKVELVSAEELDRRIRARLK